MKYIIQKTKNTENSGTRSYYSVDIVLETKDGYTFVCDCGDWDNEAAMKMARKIRNFLNRDLQIKRWQEGLKGFKADTYLHKR